MTETVESKELTTVRQQASKALGAAETLVIASPDDMAAATDVLSKIKTVGKMIKERKESITRPLNESLKSVRDLFQPIESNHADAERIIKGKMLAWQDAEEKRIAREQLAIAKRVEKGTMKPETAVAKMENVGTVQTTSKGKIGEVSTRIVKKYRVTDESKLPREYLIPNMPKITEDLKSGRDVPGAEIYEEKSMVQKYTKRNR